MERSVKDLAKYRFDCCVEAFCDAKIMCREQRYKNTLNRAYYAIFYAIRAVNALDGFDSSKHSGVIAHFNQSYVKTGIFPKEASKQIRAASERRENADYLDFYFEKIFSGKSPAPIEISLLQSYNKERIKENSSGQGDRQRVRAGIPYRR